MPKLASKNLRNNFLTNKEIRRKEQLATDNSVKCSCGHTVLITNKYKRVICNWCGRYVYLSEEDRKKYEEQEFVYRMKGMLKREQN